MLRGHVDVVSDTEVAGWAINDDNPETPIDVAIYVDDQRLTTAPCNIARHEHRNAPVAGPATHCFVHKFDPPLPIQERPHRVTVRFGPNGVLLGGGDVVLPKDSPRQPTDLNARLAPTYFHLPAPTTARAVFELLALYDPRQGLYTLLNQIDFTVAAQLGIDYAALLHVDKSMPAMGELTAQTAKDRLYDALLSTRFQQTIMAQVLKAYPEKQRYLFVHIPKCAGSDLTFNLVRRYPSIDRQIANPVARDKPTLFDELARTLRMLRFSSEVFVRGHVNLAYYENNALIRPSDRIFTIMRDPVGIAISHVNYILTRFRNDARARRAGLDTRGWLRVLKMDFDPDALAEIDFPRFGRQILRDHRIVLHNPMCTWLGGGGSARVVLDRLDRHSVEVTNTRNYEAWLAKIWGIGHSDRRNESFKFISADTLPPEDIEYLRSVNEQDFALFDAVNERLRVSGTPSIRMGSAKIEKILVE